MEAVHVRDASLRLYNNCTHLKKPSEIIRHLEDEFSKAEIKLSNFPDLMLKEPDRVWVLLQAIPNEVRQYVVLHGKSGRWDELVDSCKFYEQQLRIVDAASMRQVEQQILCPYCGKKGHAKKDCWKWQRERGGKAIPTGNPRVMEKEKMVASAARGKAMRRASIKGMERAKMMEKERRRSSRRTSAIGADRQVAMGAMQAQMGIEALQVAALRKGLL